MSEKKKVVEKTKHFREEIKSLIQRELVTYLRNMFKFLDDDEITVSSTPDRNGCIHFKIPSMIFSIGEEGIVTFYGMVGVFPNVIAEVILDLVNVITVSKIRIGDSFILDREGQVIFGGDNITKYFEENEFKSKITGRLKEAGILN